MQNEEVRICQPSVLFPQRLQQSKLDSQYAKFLNIFKKLEINIPFVKALAQMPHYAKFMKDIINKKKKLDEGGVVSLFSNCSAIIMRNLPHKMQDLRSFTIPCTIGYLMPLSVVKRLSLGELTLLEKCSKGHHL